MKKYFLYLGLSALVISCEKEIPLDEEDTAPRIVLNSAFAGGDTITIHLSESRNILYDNELPNIENAQAQLFDANDNLLGTFTHHYSGYYSLDSFYTAFGNTYTIKVAANGLPNVSATAYVPLPAQIDQIDTFRTESEMRYEITITDQPNEDNFYLIQLYQTAFYDFGGMGSNFTVCTKHVQVENGVQDIDGETCDHFLLFKDDFFDGSSYTFSVSQEIHFADCTEVVIHVRSLSEDYYKYKISHNKYNQVGSSPFAQPVQVFSNIENGFGIFGGYSQFTDTITWKW